jgi:hypothetical protein
MRFDIMFTNRRLPLNFQDLASFFEVFASNRATPPSFLLIVALWNRSSAAPNATWQWGWLPTDPAAFLLEALAGPKIIGTFFFAETVHVAVESAEESETVARTQQGRITSVRRRFRYCWHGGRLATRECDQRDEQEVSNVREHLHSSFYETNPRAVAEAGSTS